MSEMTPIADAAAVRRVPLFRNFGEREIAEIAAAATYRSYRKHDFVMREGDAGGTFFILMQGSVSVCRLLSDGREMILAILKEGDFFGEMAMFDSSLRSASIKALTDVQVATIRYADFLVLLEENPHIGRSLAVALAARLRAANDLIAATMTQDVRMRLASLLLNLSAQFGEPAANGETRIGLLLASDDIASIIATTSDTVNRALKKLRDDNIIDLRAAHIVIRDAERLRALAP